MPTEKKIEKNYYFGTMEVIEFAKVSVTDQDFLTEQAKQVISLIETLEVRNLAFSFTIVAPSKKIYSVCLVGRYVEGSGKFTFHVVCRDFK